jgi:hypothetical protein
MIQPRDPRSRNGVQMETLTGVTTHRVAGGVNPLPLTANLLAGHVAQSPGLPTACDSPSTHQSAAFRIKN